MMKTSLYQGEKIIHETFGVIDAFAKHSFLRGIDIRNQKNCNVFSGIHMMLRQFMWSLPPTLPEFQTMR